MLHIFKAFKWLVGGGHHFGRSNEDKNNSYKSTSFIAGANYIGKKKRYKKKRDTKRLNKGKYILVRVKL